MTIIALTNIIASYSDAPRSLHTLKAIRSRTERHAAARTDWLDEEDIYSADGDAITGPGLTRLCAVEPATLAAWHEYLSGMDDADEYTMDDFWSGVIDEDDEPEYADVLPEDLLPQVDEDIDPACGGWGTSLDFEGWYGFHTFTAR